MHPTRASGLDLVDGPRGQGRGHQLVVGGLVEIRGRQLLLRGVDAPGQERLVQDGVDLVERQPVLHPMAVALDQDADVALVEPDEVAAHPAVVGLSQVQRGLVVRDRHQRCDAVALQLVEHPVVEGQAVLVGGLLVALGEYAAPGDRHPEHLEAHLGKHRDVLGVPVVEVDPDQLQVVRSRVRSTGALDPHRCHILDGQALAALVVGALHLVGRRRAAPEEAGREG